MKKRIFKINLILMLLLTVIMFGSCSKNKPVEETFPDLVNSLSSYKLTGRLESNFPSGTKECNVTTYYKAPNMYRLELQNPNTTETQVMVKNSTGVYVLVPSVNKTFKVNSSWPANSSYPYLLQSLSNDMISDTNMISTKDENHTTVELKAKLFNGDEQTSQKIIFDEENMPKEVLVYDSNKNLLTRFVINEIQKNIEIEDTTFEATETLETLNEYYQENPVEFERIIRYPTYFPEGSSLDEEVISGTSNDKMAVMKFTGTTNYTIVQEYVLESSTNICEYVNGDIYVMGGSFSFVNNNNIIFYEEGMQYMIASNEVTILEMIKMGESLKALSDK